jgi:hypothetical protein
MEPAKRERAKCKALKQKSTSLNVQLLWGCDAWNVTPEEAAHSLCES